MLDVTTAAQIVLPQQLANQINQHFRSDAIAQFGNEAVLEALLPQLYGKASIKKSRPLEKVDHYMLEETRELYRRLRRFCLTLGIDDNTEFQVKHHTAFGTSSLHIIGNFNGREELTQLINNDRWFVGSFEWLQPNYASLAHSFEMLEFSYIYEQSPDKAAQQYAHFDRSDKGMAFALSHAQGCINAQVESPVNLYCV